MSNGRSREALRYLRFLLFHLKGEPVKQYAYVGPRRIADRVDSQPVGFAIQSEADVLAWVHTNGERTANQVTVTYVVNTDGLLLIADRHCEHVACAGKQPVLAAGEMTFAILPRLEVVEVSNQSTGYCPEPESWPAVARALARAGLRAPHEFSLKCDFRHCTKCGNVTLIKNSIFECGMCGADLPASYNVQ